MRTPSVSPLHCGNGCESDNLYIPVSIAIVVLQGSTVRNVMQAIERGVKAKKKETTVISW